jgi:5-oxopent-3-ene-1,2,5-tricarboxylate decarboxylase/2-hydroxyhepta-2,4-diene-1,7-dioate isomerase
MTTRFVSIGSLRTVYGTLLNSRAEFEAWAPKMNQAPYQAPPKAPVLYIKPANTWSADGADIVLPVNVPEVEIGATVAVVMKAPGEAAGYLLMNDLSVPHASYFRPPVRFKCLDGFLGVGGTLLAAGAAIDPSGFRLEVRINGELRQTVTFDQLVRTPSQLLADIGEFMTLSKGDALMLGMGANRPRAQGGDRIEITAEGFGSLSNRLVTEAA